MRPGLFISPSDQEVREICRVINSSLGFKYSVEKKYLIASRLNRRLQQLGLHNYRQYLEILHKQPEEHGMLFELLTTNITSFFREPKHFEFLMTVLLPQIKAQARGKAGKLRCWSAGCSSGEEAYSIAISCREVLRAEWDIKVLASDINSVKLKSGADGKYTGEQLKTVPPEWRQKYFHLVREGEKALYRVIPGLRERVFFRLMNLLDHQSLPDGIHFSLIFCRNVFIYLSDRARKELLAHFYRRLCPGGYIFLGHSESINTIVDSNWLALGNCIYQKRVGEHESPQTRPCTGD